MALSAFTEKSRPPSKETLSATLGKAHAAWIALVEAVAARVTPLDEAWGFTSKSTGWGLRLKQGERVILYVTPREGSFLVSCALGEKAVDAARAAKLPKWLLDAIDAAPKYAEGRGVRVEVRDVRRIEALAELARIKAESGARGGGGKRAGSKER